MAAPFNQKDSERVEIVSELFRDCSDHELEIIRTMKRENAFREHAKNVEKSKRVIKD